MMRIANCESHYQVGVVSPPDYDGIVNYGWLQLHGDPAGVDPVYAVDVAHDKFTWARQRGGTGYEPWGCY